MWHCSGAMATVGWIGRVCRSHSPYDRTVLAHNQGLSHEVDVACLDIGFCGIHDRLRNPQFVITFRSRVVDLPWSYSLDLVEPGPRDCHVEWTQSKSNVASESHLLLRCNTSPDTSSVIANIIISTRRTHRRPQDDPACPNIALQVATRRIVHDMLTSKCLKDACTRPCRARTKSQQQTVVQTPTLPINNTC
ncbi:hypothetical protein EJ03DRAFT_194549 [Teratosphaeria nubilosa]|uniref:Uncharacterized protein n=1 Tax=Teratosphaeria nubilosa TaxID=161662 RepID=A0A6G1KZ45_9PEZI|nr:hypothetical protein EJ03DRAFT_194549 [Teratosphaeria nubilosa]